MDKRRVDDRLDAHEDVHRDLAWQPRVADRVGKPQAAEVLHRPRVAPLHLRQATHFGSTIDEAAVDLVGGQLQGQRKSHRAATDDEYGSLDHAGCLSPSRALMLPAKIASCSDSLSPISAMLAIVARM